jgi:hypothetical protein
MLPRLSNNRVDWFTVAVVAYSSVVAVLAVALVAYFIATH